MSFYNHSFYSCLLPAWLWELSRKSPRDLWAPQALLSPFHMGGSATLPSGSRAQDGPLALPVSRLASQTFPIRSLAGKERGSSRLELFFMLFLLFHPSISSSFQKKCFLCAKGKKPEQVQGVPEGHFLFQRRIWDMSKEVFPKSTPCLAWVQT